MISVKHWRLNWTLDQLFTFSNYRKHNQVLHSSWLFWFALIVKFFPNLYRKPILFSLKEGGCFKVVDFMSLYIYYEIFLEKSYDHPELKRDNPVIIDIGANTGLFSIRMKQLYTHSNLYCFEPFLSNFNQLSENIRLSKLRNIELFQKGVGGRSRSEKLYINKKNLGGHSLFELEARSSEYINIEILGIEEALNSLGSPYFHLIKMDCEGAEFEIIKAIDKELASRIEIILFESTESVYNLNELIDHLTFLGFDIEFKEKSCNYIARNLNFHPLI